MPSAYAHAILNLIERGNTPHEAVKRVFVALSEKGRAGLARHVARSLSRIAVEKQRKAQTLLIVAHDEDAKKALKETSVKDATVSVDSTLIGGWRLETHDAVTDHSWKKQLQDIYQQTINV